MTLEKVAHLQLDCHSTKSVPMGSSCNTLVTQPYKAFGYRLTQLLLTSAVVRWSIVLIRQIRFLEDLIIVCAHC